MKTIKWSYFFFAIMLVFSSCKEIVVTTKVNKDGSFTRTITITGDSTEVVKSATPYPVDNSWEKQFSRDENDSSKYILVYTKFYENSDVLDEEIQADTSKMNAFSRNIEISKHFGFFYSYLTFKETYNAYNPFTNIDYKKYMSEEDLTWLDGNKKGYSHADSLKLEIAKKKQDEFMIDAASEEVMNGLKEGIKRLNDPSLTIQLIEQNSDSIKKWVGSDLLSDTAIFNLLEKTTGNEAFSKLLELKPPVLQAYNESMGKLLKIIEFEDYTQEVEMPGIITETNSTELKGNQVSWEVSGDSFFFKDYLMYVESRVVNYWVFILTGIVILSLIILLLMKGFRK